MSRNKGGQFAPFCPNHKHTHTMRIYLDGIGWVFEVTQTRVNKDGINEPFVIYIPINKGS